MPAPIVVPAFFATKPRISPKHLEAVNAQVSQNCNTKRGILSPLMDLEAQNPNPISKAGAIRSIYKLKDGTWLYWSSVVDVVEAAVNDADSRIHFTGDSYPKQTDATLATSGAADTYPTETKRLGLPKPSAPLNVQLSPASVAEDAEIERSTSYVYTYVTSWGEESEPSDPTGVFEVKTGQSCVLTNFTPPTLAGVSISHYRVYRLNSGDSSAEFQLVPYSSSADDIPASDTSFTDNVADSDLSSEVLPTENWNKLPDDAFGLMHTGNGLFFAFKDKEVYPSESYIPYAYPWNFRLSVPHDIVTGGYFNQTVVVLTTGHAHLIGGLDPESLSMDKVSYNQACISKRSVANSPGGVIYASPDGLVMIGPEGQTVLTRSVYTKKQWRDLPTSSLIGFYQDGQYIGFFEGTGNGIIFDFESQDIGNISLVGKKVYGGYVDTEDDALYLLTYDDTDYRIEKWEGAATAMTYTWKSKDFFYSTALNLGAARIMGKQAVGDPVYFKVYRNGVHQETKIITNDEPFRLTNGVKGYDWEFQVEGTAKVFEVRMAASITELQYAG
ncbi:hypothetical protein SYK_02920 [Pseudodesulfovibrio nedwellii]|uniref:Fibronectin type-III domain-containing protein n=1 Tax=Pseudodesulfovibrio nedwellii TaxID=2973072 RepID=A0ABN6S1Q0_9BACT|nr:hypothetical protein [Pseudodesulfovibrio nedwellii]BDQ35932.1 hypothetical protein SYK_02920 [Pseudodesulfovibrio nedwellii]